ncbi:MAG: permease, partial [Rhizobiales bacterium 32-66-8]
ALPVVAIGFAIGLVGAVLGVGGGFILVPALIDLLKAPTQTAVGTSLVLTFVTMAAATVLHAQANGTVDVVLALVLMVGGTMGAQFGARTGQSLRAEHLRLLLGLLVLGVAVRVAGEFVTRPADTFVVTTMEKLR